MCTNEGSNVEHKVSVLFVRVPHEQMLDGQLAGVGQVGKVNLRVHVGAIAVAHAANIIIHI